MLTINVSGRLFYTTKRTLEAIPYIKDLLELPGEIFIDRNPNAFECILNYIRDNHNTIPSKYIYEINFYNIDYPKYTKDNLSIVTVIVQDTKFYLKSGWLMRNSIYFAETIKDLFIGTDVYLDIPVEGFRHILHRMYDDMYSIPFEYAKLIKFFGVSNIDLGKEYVTTLTINNKEFHVSSTLLFKIPFVRFHIREFGYVPRILYDGDDEKDLLRNIIEVCKGYMHNPKPNIIYKDIFNRLEIKYNELYYIKPSNRVCEHCDCNKTEYKPSIGYGTLQYFCDRCNK